MKRLERFFLFGCFVLLLAFTCDKWIAGTAQNSLTPSESRGKQIYIHGTSPSGKEILAYVGDSSLEVPGSALPCANCHGMDGIGKPEGGIIPTNLTWDALTKPYGVATPLGRNHPPYTDRALELALTRGVDPAGNKLSSVMPRYALMREDLSDLIAYLHRLGKDTDPGITENGLVIGTILPAKGPLTEMGDAIKAMTSAFFDELNSQGGIYNRRIELKFVEAGETSTATRANVERFLVNERPFAMTGAFIAGSENEIVPLMSEKEIPLVGPVTLYPRTGFPLNRQVFYLLSGINEQARALVDFAAAKPELKNAGVGVVYAQNPTNSTVTEAIKDQAKKRGLATPQIYSYQPGAFDVAETGKQFYRTHPGAIFFIGNGEDLMRLMTTAEKSDPVPNIFLPGAVSAEVFAAPAAFDGKIFVSFPTSPTDQTEDGKKEFRVLAAKYQLPAKHLAVQLSVYSAAKILTEALKRTGRDLSRERLIRSLEGFSEYSTGLTPSISYGPNRRIGASGAYVITIDLKNQQYSPVSGWISIN